MKMQHSIFCVIFKFYHIIYFRKCGNLTNEIIVNTSGKGIIIIYVLNFL